MLNSNQSKHKVTNESSSKIVPMPGKTADVVSNAPKAAKNALRLTFRKPKLLFRKMVLASFLLLVLLPGALGSIYFLMIASDRYVSSAGFSVRTLEGGAISTDFLGALTGASTSGSTTTDSYIIMRYLESRELLEKLINEADFLNAYSADHADFFYRLDPEDPIEDILEYWEWMIEPSYDNTSGLIEFQVEAFTREDALKVANLVVKYSQELVNELSDQARRDAVAFSKEEVAKAELRLKFIRNKLREFRSETKAVDPESSAGAQVSLTTELEQQLISLNARLTAARNGQLDEDSPTVRELKRQIKALEEQLVLKKAEIESSGSGASLSEILSDFERLQVDLEFAQQAYTAAMSSPRTLPHRRRSAATLSCSLSKAVTRTGCDLPDPHFEQHTGLRNLPDVVVNRPVAGQFGQGSYSVRLALEHHGKRAIQI